MTADSVSLRQRAQVCGAFSALALALLALSGCATAPVTHKALPDAETRVAKLTPVVAPPTVSVFELSAGGVSEKRDDWTAQVTTHVSPLLSSNSGYAPAPAITAEQKAAVEAELQEVVALLQMVTLNHMVHLIAPPEISSRDRPLTHNLGRIDKILDAIGADSLLVTFVHDEYSTGGRKALMALGFLVGGVTGVYIVPRGGITVNAAALVERDGTIVWMNYAGSGGDMRTPEGSAATVKALLSGLPGRPATKATR